MSDCCFAQDCDSRDPRKHRCPVSGQEHAEVSARTIAHSIKDSWDWTQTASRYFFCDDPECDVVYFGDDGSTVLKSQLRASIGVKGKAGDGLLCYCFGVSNADFQRNPAVKDYMMAQTKAGLCSCETSNPSGRCCLKDFSKAMN